MRGQEVCIFCRNISRLSINSNGRRTVSSRSRPNTYDASKLVLDLDAADSKYVRRYEEQTEEPSDSNERIPRKKVAKRELATVSTKRRTVPDTHKATGADYMTFALFGDPFLDKRGSFLQNHSPAHGRLRKVLGKNYVQTRVGSFRDHVQMLKENAGRPMLSDSTEPLSPEQQNDSYRDMLRDCHKFHQLTSTTSMISRTRSGCEYLANNGAIVAERIRDIRRWDPKAAGQRGERETLKFINALFQRLESFDSGNVNPDSALSEAGLYYAAKLKNYPTTYKYLNYMSCEGQLPQDLGKKAMTISVRRYTIDPDGDMHVEGLLGLQRPTYETLLKLLTGWHTDGIPQPHEERDASFASIINGDDLDFYSAYLAQLGELGALKAMWHETLFPLTLRKPGSAAQRAEHFHRALASILNLTEISSKASHVDPPEPHASVASVDKVTAVFAAMKDMQISDSAKRRLKDFTDYFRSTIDHEVQKNVDEGILTEMETWVTEIDKILNDSLEQETDDEFHSSSEGM